MAQWSSWEKKRHPDNPVIFMDVEIQGHNVGRIYFEVRGRPFSEWHLPRTLLRRREGRLLGPGWRAAAVYDGAAVDFPCPCLMNRGRTARTARTRMHRTRPIRPRREEHAEGDRDPLGKGGEERLRGDECI